ncbi:asparagine synthase-related protein [Neobacillus sp. M.A.Huq-85]
MSAITGIYHFDRSVSNTELGMTLMKNFQKFPADHIQTWHKENIFFGCHAQWITPESINEKLPFYDDERQMAITSDPIVDNRSELFERLHVDSLSRKTMTDSQLILLAYEKWGEDVPKYLIGDFAFMIWDERKRKLFGARDFSGARTLYYLKNNHYIAFSTTIEPLFSLPNVKKVLNEQWLAEFLAIPTMVDAVDIYSTVYKGIEQLPPSHSITISDGRVELKRYSTLPEEGKKLKLSSNQEYEDAFREVFQQAVSARIRTHHNVGAHLSGGLDSSSVVSFAAPMLHKENKCLHTFSYVPVDSFIDWTSKNRMANERPYIQETIKFIGNIKDNYLSFEGNSPLTVIDDCLETMEMPYKFYANSYWLKGIFEKAHEQQVGVLLNGQRGNTTISWGNALEYQISLLKKLKWVQFYREVQLFSKNRGVSKSRILSAIKRKLFPTELTTPGQDPQLINDEFAERTKVFERIREQGLDLNNSLSWHQFRNKNFEQLFHWNINGTYATKLSLRHKVWDRDPTNDLRLIRFCLSLPDEQFVQNGWDRALIRRTSSGYIPDKVRLNFRIRGIQGADGIHRMTDQWEDFIDELQQMNNDTIVSEFFNKEFIANAISRIRDKPRPEDVFDNDFIFLMRSLIVSRFLQKFA